MNKSHLLAALCIILLASCTPLGIPASKIESVSDYVDGVAIAHTNDGRYYFIDHDLVAVNDGHAYTFIGDFTDGYALAQYEVTKGNNTTRYEAVVDRAGKEYFRKERHEADLYLAPKGHIWVDESHGLEMRRVADGKVLLSENASLLSVTPAGTALLARRTNKHVPGYDFIDIIEYMLVDADARILQPWGRIGYVEPFSCGLAPASNEGKGVMRPQSEKPYLYSFHPAKSARRGYIDERGQMVIAERFHEASPFNESGYARVNIYDAYNQRGRQQFIDRTGRILTGAEEDTARRSFME